MIILAGKDTFGIDTLNGYMLELLKYLNENIWGWSLYMVETARALGVIFALLIAAREAYKLMALQGNQLDILAIGKPLLFSLLLANWNLFAIEIFTPGEEIQKFFETKFQAQRGKVDNNIKLRREKTSELASIMLTKSAAADLEKGETDFKSWDDIEISEEEKKGLFGEIGDFLEKAGGFLWENTKALGGYAARMVANAVKSLQLQASAYFTSWILNFLMWVGEALWQMAIYFTFLIKALYKTVLVVFGPVYVICALVPAWGGALTDWISKAVKVSLYGAMAYLVMTYSMLVINFCLESDIKMLSLCIAQGHIDFFGGSGMWGTITQTFIAYITGFAALLKAPAMAELAFPGASGMGDAAGSFIQGTAGKGANTISRGAI